MKKVIIIIALFISYNSAIACQPLEYAEIKDMSLTEIKSTSKEYKIKFDTYQIETLNRMEDAMVYGNKTAYDYYKQQAEICSEAIHKMAKALSRRTKK